MTKQPFRKTSVKCADKAGQWPGVLCSTPGHAASLMAQRGPSARIDECPVLKSADAVPPSYGLEMIDTFLAYVVSLGIIVAGAGWIAVDIHSALCLGIGIASIFVGVGSLLNEAQHGT